MMQDFSQDARITGEYSNRVAPIFKSIEFPPTDLLTAVLELAQLLDLPLLSVSRMTQIAMKSL